MGDDLPTTEHSAAIVLDRPRGVEGKIDRRSARTRRALLTAFIELVLERNYAAIGIGDIVERADVGRSTFYSHFRSKDAVLVGSMQWMFEILADCCLETEPREPVYELVEHFWSNRRLARIVLAPPIDRKLRRALTATIIDRIERRPPKGGPRSNAGLAATAIAAAQLGVLEAWTRGDIAAPARQVGETIIAIAAGVR